MIPNYNTLIVLDFETGSVDPHTTVPLQLAAKAINWRTLEPVPDAEFNRLIKPNDDEWGKVEQGALNVNKLTVEILQKEGIDRQLAWKEFTDFVYKFNPKKSVWEAPMMGGQNIMGFDKIIIERMCKAYGPTDKNGSPTLFQRRDYLDLMHDTMRWFSFRDKPENLKLDTLLEFFGMEKDGAHNALVDVKNTAELLIRFQKLYRTLGKKVKFNTVETKE